MGRGVIRWAWVWMGGGGVGVDMNAILGGELLVISPPTLGGEVRPVIQTPIS